LKNIWENSMKTSQILAEMPVETSINDGTISEYE
jgi:hypothetical protein